MDNSIALVLLKFHEPASGTRTRHSRYSRHCFEGVRTASTKTNPLSAPKPAPASVEAPDDVPCPSPLITTACKLEGKINRRNDLELPARGKDEAVEATGRMRKERGRGERRRRGRRGWTRKRAPGSHKGDERKSGAIRMMPFARSSSLRLPPAVLPHHPPLYEYASSLSPVALTKYQDHPLSLAPMKRRGNIRCEVL